MKDHHNTLLLPNKSHCKTENCKNTKLTNPSLIIQTLMRNALPFFSLPSRALNCSNNEIDTKRKIGGKYISFGGMLLGNY